MILLKKNQTKFKIKIFRLRFKCRVYKISDFIVKIVGVA